MEVKSFNKLAKLYLISFLDLFAIGLTFPLFSLHLRSLGVSHITIGIISSVYSGTQFLSGPIIGSWSDVSDRKRVFVITLIISTIGYILLGWVHYIQFFFMVRFLLGVFKHTQSLCKAFIVDWVSYEEQPGALGMSTALSGIGFIIGPIIGGHISELPNGFAIVCSLTAVLYIINIGLAATLPSSNIKSTKNNNYNPFTIAILKQEITKAFIDVIKMDWSRFWQSFLLRFLFALSTNMYFSNQAVYLKEHFLLTQKHIGYIISFYSLIGTAAGFMLNYISNKFYKNDLNCRLRLLHCFLIMTVSIVLLYLSPSIYMFLVFLIPCSICSTILRTVSMELMFKQSEDSHRGSLSGASNSIMSSARFFVPFITGVISETYGTHFLLLLTAMPTLLGSVICYNLKNIKCNGKAAKIDKKEK